VTAVRLSGCSTFEESVCLVSVLQLENCNRQLGVCSILTAVGSRTGRYDTEPILSESYKCIDVQ
jgi:hypothetical protein